MKKAQGFTLIELVIVIIILGILAVTAAPKFIDIASDAHAATMKGVKASLEGAKTMVYAKAAVKGKEKSDDETITVNGETIKIVYGYPAAASAELKKIIEISDGDFLFVDGTNLAYVYPKSSKSPTDATAAGTCYVKYEVATFDTSTSVYTPAKVSTIVTGC